MTEQLYFDDVTVGDTAPPLVLTVDPVQMFFFSAATYNGHRIHYDRTWAREVEGYDDLLVHGPLQVALMARVITDWIGGRGRLIKYAVQNRASAFAGEELTFTATVTGTRPAAGGWRGRPRGRSAQERRRRAAARHRHGPAATEGRTLMGLRGEAAIIGFVELAPERKASRPPMFSIEQYASLSQARLSRGFTGSCSRVSGWRPPSGRNTTASDGRS